MTFTKFKFNNQVRKTRLSSETILALRAHAEKLFGKCAEECKFLYIDNDNEKIEIVEDQDLEICIEEAQLSGTKSITLEIIGSEQKAGIRNRSASLKRKASANKIKKEELPLKESSSEESSSEDVEKLESSRSLIQEKIQQVKVDSSEEIKKLTQEKEKKLQKLSMKMNKANEKLARKMKRHNLKNDKKDNHGWWCQVKDFLKTLPQEFPELKGRTGLIKQVISMAAPKMIDEFRKAAEEVVANVKKESSETKVNEEVNDIQEYAAHDKSPEMTRRCDKNDRKIDREQRRQNKDRQAEIRKRVDAVMAVFPAMIRKEARVAVVEDLDQGSDIKCTIQKLLTSQ